MTSKIINGKKYDTETAEKIAKWDNNHNYSDFHHCSETLYRKKNGEYFISGKGGAMSDYGISAGTGSRCGGSDVFVLSENEAKKWVENKDNDAYETIFGAVTE